MGEKILKLQYNFFMSIYSRLKIIGIGFVFSGFLFYASGTNHYIDKNANGNNDGTSWANAWESFTAINWSTIQPGDFIYISGGNNSTIYNETLTIGATGTSGNPITIARSSENGHDGEVIIDGQSTVSYGILNESSNSNIIVDGVDKTKFIIRQFTSVGIRLRYNGNILVKNFTIELNEPSAFSGIFLFGGEWQTPPTFAGPYTIENFTIIQDSGSYAGGGNSDGIQVGGVDGVTVKNGYIRLWNSNPTPHSDDIQLYHCKNVIIENNKLYHFDAGATSNKQGIYLTNSGGNIKIRNNYISLASNAFGSAIAIEEYDNNWWTVYTPPDSFIISNNTVVCKYDAPNAIRLVQSLSPTNFSANSFLLNNIFVKGSFAIDRKFFSSGTNCDYNNYYDGGSVVTIYDQTTNSSGNSRTWADWQSYGFDTHSYITDPQLTGYMPSGNSNAVDHGAMLNSMGYNHDITGLLRPEGNGWDIGAAEFPEGGGGGNNPPSQPANPGPSNGALNQPVNSTLNWICSDPNGDPLTYDVYFGTANNPPLASGNQTGTSYNPGALDNNTTYYWKIVAKDNQGATTAGPVWNFSTEATGIGGDITPPEVQSAEILDSVSLKIIFSEPLDQATAQNTGNYSITNSVDVISALLSGSEVTLTTTSHSPGAYTVTVINVEDLAGNQIVPPNNTADYEYVSNSYSVRAKIKVFLEGPYTDSSMATTLSENSLIPLIQPYSGLPWSYDGNEGVSEIPSNIVDWILLELRTGTGATTVVSRRAALLRSDGIALDTDGQPGITFPGIESGEYYIVVFHRNHLAIMSKNPVLLTGTTNLYDFTFSEDQSYGDQPMKPLGNGKYGLYAADGNANGSINNSDYNSIWKKENGSAGYEKGDFDLNGGVTIADRNSKWKPNNGHVTRVPMN